MSYGFPLTMFNVPDLPLEYAHICDGKVVAGELHLHKCPAKLTVYFPDDLDDHCCIVIPSDPHNHPFLREDKVTPKAVQTYNDLMTESKMLNPTVQKINVNTSIYLEICF
jgi:hypothetical protein